MKFASLKKLLITSFACALLSVAAIAELPKGKVKATQIKGDVALVNESTGATYPLYNGQIFGEGYSVDTGANSSCMLVLSNGSIISIASDSSLSVTSFKQESFDTTAGQFELLEADPSQSQTELTLNYGELLGDVKKLGPKSKFDVVTQAGTAGIRGTPFYVAFELNFDNGNYNATIANLGGKITSTTFDLRETAPLQQIESNLNIGAKIDTSGLVDLNTGGLLSSASLASVITNAEKSLLANIALGSLASQSIINAINVMEPAETPLAGPATITTGSEAQANLNTLANKTKSAFTAAKTESQKTGKATVGKDAITTSTSTPTPTPTPAGDDFQEATPPNETIDNSLVDENEIEESPSNPTPAI